MRLIMVRHGETLWNNQRRLQGQTDEPLSDRGRAQARALAPLIAKSQPKCALTSDLARAAETAGLLGFPQAVREPRLREMDLGAWSGRLVADIEAESADAYRGWRAGTFTPPGAEPWDAFKARVSEALSELDGDQDALIVAHGGVIRAACDALLGLTPERVVPVGPASMTTLALTRSGRGWRGRLEAYNVNGAAPDLDAPD